MPVIDSKYKPPFWTKNGFVSTVYSGLIRKVRNFHQERERIILNDGDFIDLDWSFSTKISDKVIVLLHGLEGNAQRPYITGMAKLSNTKGIDACAVNFRSCSGTLNRSSKTYHSGETQDLHEIIEFLLAKKSYQEIYIKGISLGANVALKYIGEERQISDKIKAVVAVSVPCYLKGSCLELLKFKNKPFMIRFLKHLKSKVLQKQKQFPDLISEEALKEVKNLKDLDDVYTSKVYGFNDAFDYYEKSSSLQYLSQIKIPTLILNALNDSFLSPECYPVKEAKENNNLYLEMPKHGGHVGFILNKDYYYNEVRTIEFLLNNL